MNGRGRAGLTLVETLVAIGIIGILVAITLPAVVHVREVGHRATCADRLRQVGLALQQHHSARGHYPSVFAGRYVDERGRGIASGPSAFYDLLPFLDQMPLHRAWDFEAGGGPAVEWNPQNHTARTTVIATLICPSDGRMSFDGVAPTSYRFNVTIDGPRIDERELQPGSNTYAAGSLHAAAAFEPVRHVTSKDLRDGQSTTAGISERLIGSRGTQFDRRRDFWFTAVYPTHQPITPHELARLCSALRASPPTSLTNFGEFWSSPWPQDTRYNHALTPNSPAPDCTSFGGPQSLARGTQIYDAGIAARSDHSGGVHGLFMDGSVRFCRQSVSPALWWALGTRAGGETVPAEF